MTFDALRGSVPINPHGLRLYGLLLFMALVASYIAMRAVQRKPGFFVSKLVHFPALRRVTCGAVFFT